MANVQSIIYDFTGKDKGESKNGFGTDNTARSETILSELGCFITGYAVRRHPLELFLHQMGQRFRSRPSAAGQIFPQMEQIVVCQVWIIARSIRPIGPDAVIEVVIRHDPLGAGIFDRQQHTVGKRKKIFPIQKLRRVIQRQTFGDLMVERGMRRFMCVRMPVIRDQPAAVLRGNVVRICILGIKQDNGRWRLQTDCRQIYARL